MVHTENLTIKQIVKSFISGGIAGVVSKTMVAPIERVKYLYLTRSTPFTYKTFIKDFRDIVKNHGVLNLWRGNLMSVIKVFPYAAIDFACFDFMRKRFYNKKDGTRSKIALFLCGTVSGTAAMSSTLALDFMRIRMAMEKDKLSYTQGYRNTLKHIYSFEGARGFYRGYFASLIGIVIYHGNAFFIFTKLKQYVRKNIPSQYTKWYMDFLLGSISSMSLIAAYPFDIVKKRMQGQSLLVQRGEIKKLMRYRELISHMWHHEGWVSFFKGLSINFLKTPFTVAISWTVKNRINRFLDEHYDF